MKQGKIQMYRYVQSHFAQVMFEFTFPRINQHEHEI